MSWWNPFDVPELFLRHWGSRAEGASAGPVTDVESGDSSADSAKTDRAVPPTLLLPESVEPDATELCAPLEFSRNNSNDELIADTIDPEASAPVEVDSAVVTVPGYEILQELGRGGMGVVYRARHQGLQREVALKMILAGAHAGKEGLARFRAEAEAAARLQHPNIVQVFEIGEHNGCPYFSLELADGGSLNQRIREAPLSPRAAARLMESLARAVDFAHQRGVVHRDLKPGNILLSSVHGRSTVVASGSSTFRRSAAPSTLGDNNWSASVVPKITDFGLAKRLDEDLGQTHSGTVLGTPSYMSPEQASGKVNELGPPTDIYALGAILYELLVGRPPFKASSPIDTIRQVIDQEPVSPRQLEPRVPLDLETICLKCLAKQPARRYLTSGELADDLDRFLADEPILARPISTTERAWKWAKRRPSTVALIGVCLAAVIAGVLFIAWHNVSLRDQLDIALAEERQARRLVADAVERQRLSQLEIEAQRLYDSARFAAAAGDLPKARLDLTKALTTLRGEPALEALRRPAEALLADVERQLAAEAERLAARARLAEFGALRDEAQFLGALYTGMELAANLQAAREAVHRALAVYGVSADSGRQLARDPYLDETEHAQTLGDCYQLLLILAETEAQSSVLLDAAEQPGRLQEALRVLDQAPRFGAPSRAYYLRRARYWHALSDRDAAAQAEQLAADTPVSDALDHFLIADELYRRGDYDGAIGEFEDVLQIQPNHFWAQYLSGLCLLRQNRTAEARIYLSACLAQGRDFVWLYLLRGFANGELQEFAAADADFQAALAMNLDDNSQYVLFVNRGVLRIRQQRFDDAIADLNEAIKLKPAAYQAFVNLAQAYRQLDDLDQALRQIDEAVQRQPTLARLYRLRGRLHVQRQENAAAIDDFDVAIRLESANSPLLADDYVERGRLLLLAGRHQDALDSLDNALKLRSDHALAMRLRAEALFHLRRFQEVIAAFDEYLKTGKPLESVYRGRGLAKSELGAFPGAIDDFTKALELKPTSAVQAYRGWMYVVVGAPQLAQRDFELAIELDSANGDAFNGRGFVRATQGDYLGAMQDAEQALKAGPRSPQLLYNAARIYALSAPARGARVFELLDESLALLPKDRRSGFWADQVRTDAALDGVRRNPRYLQLERELLQDGS